MSSASSSANPTGQTHRPYDAEVTAIADVKTAVLRKGPPVIYQKQLRVYIRGQVAPRTFQTNTHGQYFEKSALRRLAEKPPTTQTRIPLWRLSTDQYTDVAQAVPRAPSPPRAPVVSSQAPQAGPATVQTARTPAATQIWMLQTVRYAATEANAKLHVQGGSEVPAGALSSTSCVWKLEYYPVCKPIKVNNQNAMIFAEKLVWRLQNPQTKAVHVVVAPPDLADRLVSFQPAKDQPHWVSKDSAGKVSLTWFALVRGTSTKVGIQGGMWVGQAGQAGLYVFPNNAQVQRFRVA